MREPRPGQGQEPSYYWVLNRSCADLSGKIAELFADRLCIEVVVDRRKGKERMAELPPGRWRLPRRTQRQSNPRFVSVQLRKEAS